MKKLLILTMFFVAMATTASAQKFALIDLEYIMGNIPAYERANEQLNQVSKKWQAEVEAVDGQAKTFAFFTDTNFRIDDGVGGINIKLFACKV